MPDERFLHKRPPAATAERLASLTDLEYRVWTQYMLSADDFGVMRFSARTLQDDNDALASRPEKVIQAALAAVADKLLAVFEHGGRRYVYTPDWQDQHHVRYPARTSHPAPPVEHCSTHTQWLLTAHPGGEAGALPSWRAPGTFKGRRRRESEPPPVTETSSVTPTESITETVTGETTAETPPVSSYLARARPLPLPLPLAIANGERRGGIAADEAWQRFQAAYPAERRTGGFMANQAFVAVCEQIGFEALVANVEKHKRSEQWKKGMIPSLSKYFELELWRQDPKAAHAPERSRRLPSVDEIRRANQGGS